MISVTESHNRANVNRSVDESFANFEAAWAELGSDKPKLRLRAFHLLRLPWEGRVPEDDRHPRGRARRWRSRRTSRSASATRPAAPRPTMSAALFGLLMPRYASDRVTFAYHGHDTYGLGVANAIEAYRQGVRIFDGAAGGLGGCPFAPGAAGNTASEDLVFAFEHMGVKTGVDLAEAARRGRSRRRRGAEPGRRQAQDRAAQARAVGLRPRDPGSRRVVLRSGELDRLAGPRLAAQRRRLGRASALITCGAWARRCVPHRESDAEVGSGARRPGSWLPAHRAG